jgi:hypothetical protein
MMQLLGFDPEALPLVFFLGYELSYWVHSIMERGVADHLPNVQRGMIGLDLGSDRVIGIYHLL